MVLEFYLVKVQHIRAPKHLLFLVSEDWYFVSHRLTLAQQAMSEGYKVSVLCNVNNHGAVIKRAGIEVIPLAFNRSDTGLLANVRLLINLIFILRRLAPDILHNVAQKPVLFGTMAGLLCRTPKIVNAFGGLGTLFSSTTMKARLARYGLSMVYRLLFLSKRTHIIVQNRDDDYWLSHSLHIPRDRVSLIRGAGVDVTHFVPEPQVAPSVVVTLVARMLRNKGIVEFCGAARILESRGLQARFLLVGDPDPLNPTSLSAAELRVLTENSSLEWLGRIDDIRGVWLMSDISVLPSYREGLPLSLLESAAMGKPIITTDVPGCREVVENGINGFLVPPKDPLALADAIEKLVLNPELREQFGRASRERAVKEFSSERVIADTLALYEHSSHCA